MATFANPENTFSIWSLLPRRLRHSALLFSLESKLNNLTSLVKGILDLEHMNRSWDLPNFIPFIKRKVNAQYKTLGKDLSRKKKKADLHLQVK